MGVGFADPDRFCERQVWGIKTSSSRQARASAVGSVKRPSQGCTATGKKRRFRTLAEVGPVDKLDTIAELRRNKHIVHDVPIVLQKSVASICCCRSHHSILQLPSTGKSIIAAGRWAFAAPDPPAELV